jgi:hypothetical protein
MVAAAAASPRAYLRLMTISQSHPFAARPRVLVATGWGQTFARTAQPVKGVRRLATLFLLKYAMEMR